MVKGHPTGCGLYSSTVLFPLYMVKGPVELVCFPPPLNYNIQIQQCSTCCYFLFNSNYRTAHELLHHQQTPLPTPIFTSIEKQSSHCKTLLFSGIKIIMNGPVVCMLCEAKKSKILEQKMNFMGLNTCFKGYLCCGFIP